MTKEDKADFQKGLNTPLDELVDMPVDSFLKMKKNHDSFWNGMRFSLSKKAKDNYDRIKWEGKEYTIDYAKEGFEMEEIT